MNGMTRRVKSLTLWCRARRSKMMRRDNGRGARTEAWTLILMIFPQNSKFVLLRVFCKLMTKESPTFSGELQKKSVATSCSQRKAAAFGH